jgi:hypothetical protein
VIARFMRPEHLVTLELHPRLAPNEVVDGRKYLEDVLGASV